MPTILSSHHCKLCWDRNYIIECVCGCGKTKPLRDGKSRIAHPIFHPYGWGRGYYNHSDGYIYLSLPRHPTSDNRGRMLQHRFIMEKKLGRLLKIDEDVHHINGIKDDNRIENLQLMTRRTHMSLTANNKKRDIYGRFTQSHDQ